MHNSVLLISIDNGTTIGTGFVIENTDQGIYVATCGHVVNKGTKIEVSDKNAVVVQNFYKDDIDLAILYVEDLNDLKPFRLAQNSTTQKATVIGYSKLSNVPKREDIKNIEVKHQVEFQRTKAKIKALKLSPKGESISSGYSGAPVICEETGDVIGVVNIKVGEDVNYAICISHLKELYVFKNTAESSNQEIPTLNKGLVTKITPIEYELIKRGFESNFENSLIAYSGLPKVWITPIIHTKAEDKDKSSDKDTQVNTDYIFANTNNLIIRARQQYGLTSLSHFLIKERWNDKLPSFWLYLDAGELKPHEKEIAKYVTGQLEKLKLAFEDIECVILDEFSVELKDASKILEKINHYFIDKRLIIMMTVLENPLLNDPIISPEKRIFTNLYLWALPRNEIRNVVCIYNNSRYIGDENKVIAKVVTDLEVLNIPRTVLNCLTILRVSEIGFDESPVNRTEMLSRVLTLLFNTSIIADYKTRPDLKDTEYILGYFCQKMLIENNYYFTRDNFLQILTRYCIEQEIDVEVEVIFDILYSNNIFVQRGYQFCFKFRYWISYFAAQRMHQDKEFANYILQDMNYTAYPELIEFYTGIDRRRDDALQILTQDIATTRESVKEKCALPESFNIYDNAQWSPSPERIEAMHSEISDGVMGSNLPAEVKDEYADQGYDRTKSYNQSIHKIIEEYSLLRLMKSVQAGAKALRNSDYASPEIRHALLDEILMSWEQIIRVVLVLSPILAKNGYVQLEGAAFMLADNFSELPQERFSQILSLIPTNVVDWYKDDLFSKKMAPLLFKHIKGEKNPIIKHGLNLLIINKRPKGWEEHIEQYIISEYKNSFYLGDVLQTLNAEYQYSFASPSTLKSIARLIKMTLAKHELGIKKPNSEIIKKVPDKYLPTRDHERI